MSERVAVIIEDDSDIRALLRTVLEGAKYIVHAAASGMEGIDFVALHQPDIITLDISMPVMDGFETAERIRAFSNTPIIMISARADSIAAAHAHRLGVDAFISKPFRPRDLRDRIDEVLSAREAGSSS